MQVSVGGTELILDIGTGSRALGQHLLSEKKHDATLLLTHTHWDHINGFPFFAPAYHPDFKLRIMAGHLQTGMIRQVMAGQMMQPMFPVPMEVMRAQLAFEDFRPHDRFEFGDGVVVKTLRLNHPDGAVGYRIEYGGKVFCYITDTEHTIGRPDEEILAGIDGADIVVYDATYTDEEYPARVGWGHSTWQEGIRLCKMANARKLILFHHDPDHDDDRMAAIEAQAQAEFGDVVAAREQSLLTLIP
ncbi:MAG TPA: MBL fold metallo-hydrolase [Alphaproteobacteria bacterium]|nr:MBL fold metallo-hydrolase [Alphaproteobacteria bacterium]